MNYCTNCGSKIEGNASFCSYCGIECNYYNDKKLEEKIKEIQELKEKIISLENHISEVNNIGSNVAKQKYGFGWWMTVPIIGFFVFMILMVLIMKIT